MTLNCQPVTQKATVEEGQPPFPWVQTDRSAYNDKKKIIDDRLNYLIQAHKAS